MNKRTVIGEYNKLGYTISTPHNLRELYYAGNHPFDSTAVVSPNDAHALSLSKIRQMCIKTGKGVASEKGYKWGGAERIEED